MLSIIIPAYNEEKVIQETLNKIIKFLEDKNKDYELIVVDDGSKDKTRELVEKFNKVKLTKQRKNKGKGYSVRQGASMAKGDYILFLDADLSTPIEEIDKFMNYVKEYDIIIASRNLKDSNIIQKQPFYRVLLGKTFPLFVNLLAVHGIKDTQCGFKLFNKKAAEIVFPRQTIDSFGFDVELLFIARKKHLKIKELPVTWVNNTRSTVNPFTDSIRMFKDLIKIRINSLLGKYN